MTEYLFDHDRLDVYRVSIRYVANAFDTSRLLAGLHRHLAINGCVLHSPFRLTLRRVTANAA